MSSMKRYKLSILLCKIAIFLGLLLYGDRYIFFMVAFGVFILMVIRSTKIDMSMRLRVLLIVFYAVILLVHTTFFAANVWYDKEGISYYASRAVAIYLLTLPYLIENIITIKKYTEFYLPSTEEIKTISFNELKNIRKHVSDNIKGINNIRHSLSPDNLYEIIADLPRHSSIKYVNKGSLTQEYFKTAYDSLDDPYIYIVVSNTGSAASEFISVFTRKEYNHASMAFDADLKTIISYNGGENVYPPGLNHEIVEQFNKKEDSAVMVYRLKATRFQKELLIDKVKEINQEGSAYNLMGLIFRKSIKPNIMFCSQFVYTMLQLADLDYFKKRAADVKPNDFIELDYYRKLEFAFEISFQEELMEAYNELEYSQASNN